MLSCELWETVKNTIFTEHLETPASGFTERICNINLKLISQSGFSNHLRDTHKYVWEIKSSDSVIL